MLAQTVPESQAYQGGDHRVLTGALSQNGAIHPESQAPLLGWSEVWKMLGNSLVHLIPFTRKAHESPPHIPVAVNSRMKGKLGAFLLFLGEFQRLHTPVSPLGEG